MLKTIDKPDNAAILAAFRNNDNRTLEFIVREHRPKVFRQIERMGGSQEEAKDIFQQAMAAMCLKSKTDFQLTCAFSTFLYAVCQNLWRKNLKEKKNAAPG